MTADEIYSMLASTGLEVTYFMFKENEAPELPYLVYYFPKSTNVFADGGNYVGKTALNIELYTDNKDFDTEAIVEKVLNENGLAYEKTESYLDTEKMYEVLYEMEVIYHG